MIDPGDDCAAIEIPEGELLLSSIDTLIGAVHFPDDAPGALVGYRAMMVSVSDLAAMGAVPVQLLVALTLEEKDRRLGPRRGCWNGEGSRGNRRCIILGGNLARGPRSITISVHGCLPGTGKCCVAPVHAAGEGIYITGPLGTSAAAVAAQCLGEHEDPRTRSILSIHAPESMQALRLRGVAASSCIDVSDGLLQDLGHICKASGVGAELDVWQRIPIGEGGEPRSRAARWRRLRVALHCSVSACWSGLPATRIGTVAEGA